MLPKYVNLSTTCTFFVHYLQTLTFHCGGILYGFSGVGWYTFSPHHKTPESKICKVTYENKDHTEEQKSETHLILSLDMQQYCKRVHPTSTAWALFGFKVTRLDCVFPQEIGL